MTFVRCWFLLLVVAAAGFDSAFAQSAPENSDEIAVAIEALGDPRYRVRIQAEQQLAQAGLAAFDALRAARASEDPHVARTAERLLYEISTPMHLEGDEKRLKQLCRRFADTSASQRLRVLNSLTELLDPTNESDRLLGLSRSRAQEFVSREVGVAFFARALRFHPNDSVAHYAAFQLIDWLNDQPGAEGDRLRSELLAALDDLDARFGPSERPIVSILRTALNETEVATLRTALGQAAALRSEHQDELQMSLQRYLLGRAINAGDETTTLELAKELLFADEREPIVLLEEIAERLGELGRWELLDQLFEQHETLLLDRQGSYLRARLVSERGDQQRADQLADQAFKLPEGVPSGPFRERVLEAERLTRLGYPDWAERELRASVDLSQPLGLSLTLDQAYAHWKLSDLMYDSERYDQAAEAIRPLIELTSSNQGRRAYEVLREQVDSLLPELQVVRARSAFYEGLHLGRTGEVTQQIKALERAIRSDPMDADVLIAMYRIASPPEGFTERVRSRIEDLCRRFEREITRQPNVPAGYNQWAWLVGNTEGDQQKAVRYSQRSLQLSPNNPGYLDTLGHCFFAVGDFDRAVIAQQRAVDQMPGMQVMQRQLVKFKSAQQASSAKE